MLLIDAVLLIDEVSSTGGSLHRVEGLKIRASQRRLTMPYQACRCVYSGELMFG